MAVAPEFECLGGCHGGGFAGFDHYMDWLEANGWAGVEAGIAFGAWLANTLPGGWDGKAERLEVCLVGGSLDRSLDDMPGVIVGLAEADAAEDEERIPTPDSAALLIERQRSRAASLAAALRRPRLLGRHTCPSCGGPVRRFYASSDGDGDVEPRAQCDSCEWGF